MSLTIDQLTNGLTPEHDFVFADRPDNPEMRESTSVWISDAAGAVAFPRFGIEAEARSWDEPLVTANGCLPNGRLLCAVAKGAKHPARGPDGRPTILGAGPLSFHCIEPFRRWRVRYDGAMADGKVADTIDGKYDLSNQIPFKLQLDLELATPAWVMNNPPEKLAKMPEAERMEAEYMGMGWRCEQLFRGQGRYEVDGAAHDFSAIGLRVKRQSVRPLAGFRGHAWQSALFPDGRAFGYITYPPREDGRSYNEAFVYKDGRMHMGRVTKIPWLRRIVPSGDDVALEIETDLGVTRIEGVTTSSYFHRNHPGVANLDLQQGDVRYSWDGQVTHGMIERSSSPTLTRVG